MSEPRLLQPEQQFVFIDWPSKFIFQTAEDADKFERLVHHNGGFPLRAKVSFYTNYTMLVSIPTSGRPAQIQLCTRLSWQDIFLDPITL